MMAFRKCVEDYTFEELRRLSMGADALITDRPDMVYRLRGSGQ